MQKTLEIRPSDHPQADQILTSEAQAFLCQLHERFEGRRQQLLQKRLEQQAALDSGQKLDFPEETRSVREDLSWKVAPIPNDLLDRRVEITGPVDRKMVINALNSEAQVFMADFEDSNSPSWSNNIAGQVNMRDAVRRTISFTNPAGKKYQLGENPSVLMVRPRGWHLVEAGFAIDGVPMSGSLFDFGLFFFHNAKALLELGSGPYFYLPKLEHYLEARLWNDVFIFAQETLGIPVGTIRATVLIETITAAFQMDEILFELKDHSAGLNCGRWDYIFSFIKKHRSNPDYVVPDRAKVGMTVHFLNSYVELLIRTCHQRGIHAMGGMAAQIPIKGDPAANEAALEKVRQDKLREAKAGHDGTWVAHPGLIPIAREAFDAHMKGANQIDHPGVDHQVTADDLLKVPQGTITAAGVKINLDVGLQYFEAWLRGNGCVPIYNLMEDAATAEISRTQLWQWVHHGAKLEDGRPITMDMVREVLAEVVEETRQRLGDDYGNTRFDLAVELFAKMIEEKDFPEFLTLVAYPFLK